MGSKSKKLPHFESEEEELEFWDTHHPADYIEGPADIIVRLKQRPKKTVTMRLDEPLYNRLREVADRHGVPYQRLMRELLRQSLANLALEEKRSSRAQASQARPV